MPGETYQTLKDKFSQQSGPAVGAAMASQAAHVGGATSDQGFMGSAAVPQPHLAAVPNNQQQQIKDANENVIKQIEIRDKKIEEAEDQGGVYNIQTGEVEYPEKTGILKNLLPTIMRQGDHVSDPLSLTKKKWGKIPGQHKLRTQYDRLVAKYGEGWKDTVQAKSLANYLSGVAVERGGGLGAYDKSAIEGSIDDIPEIDPVTGKYRTKAERQALLESAAKERQELLDNMGVAGIDIEGWQEPSVADQLAGMDFDKLRLGLTGDQWANFTQQLMAADPTPGNMAYKAARPLSSGAGVGALATPTLSLLKGIGQSLSGMVPPEVKTGVKKLYNAAKKLVPIEQAITMTGDLWDIAGKVVPKEEIKTMWRDSKTGIGGLFDTKPEWADWGANQRPFYDTSVPDGAGIPSLPQGQLPTPTLGIPDDVANQTFKPGVDPDNPYGLPEEYMDWYGSEFDIPGAGGAMVVPITLPDGTVVNMPDTHTANQFQQYLDSLTTTPGTTTTPTPFDYASLAPQFGPQYPGYVNQGVASPQFGDWYQNLNQYYT